MPWGLEEISSRQEWKFLTGMEYHCICSAAYSSCSVHRVSRHRWSFLEKEKVSWSGLRLTDLLLRNHCLVDKVLQLLVGKVDAQLLETVHLQVLLGEKKINSMISASITTCHGKFQDWNLGVTPQTRRCPESRLCCPSQLDSATHWFAPAASQTRLNIKLWQWHHCQKGQRHEDTLVLVNRSLNNNI